MNERLTQEREGNIRRIAENERYVFSVAVLDLLAELDATRAERDAAVRDRDLLAGLIQKLALDTHDLTLPSGKHVVCDENDKWYVSGEEVAYETQLEAIRAAANTTT